jgi:hypothetical protein
LQLAATAREGPLVLWELSVVEQRYTAVQEVLGGMPVTEVADRSPSSPYRARACWRWSTAYR